MKKIKIAYYLFTGLLSAMMLMSAGMYLFNHAEVAPHFVELGYPAYIVYPLAILKVLGLVAIWTNKVPALAGMAYAGYFFNFVLALGAHLAIQDGKFGGAAAALVLLGLSFYARVRLLSAESAK